MSVREKMRKRSKKAWENAKYTGIGFEFGLSIGLSAYVGSKADAYFGSNPIGVCSGVIFGFCIGLRGLIRVARQEHNRMKTSHSVQPSLPHSTVESTRGTEDQDAYSQDIGSLKSDSNSP
jgi:F0F1-type ATP synthase assembly protein I